MHIFAMARSPIVGVVRPIAMRRAKKAGERPASIRRVRFNERGQQYSRIPRPLKRTLRMSKRGFSDRSGFATLRDGPDLAGVNAAHTKVVKEAYVLHRSCPPLSLWDVR